MKTIPELNRELEDAKLANEAYLGRKKAREIRKEIFQLKHPHIINAGKRIKKVGSSTGKSLVQMGEHAHKGIQPYAKAIKEEQKKHKTKSFDRVVYHKFQYPKKKKKSSHKQRRSRSTYSNPYSMFG